MRKTCNALRVAGFLMATLIEMIKGSNKRGTAFKQKDTSFVCALLSRLGSGRHFQSLMNIDCARCRLLVEGSYRSTLGRRAPCGVRTLNVAEVNTMHVSRYLADGIVSLAMGLVLAGSAQPSLSAAAAETSSTAKIASVVRSFMVQNHLKAVIVQVRSNGS